MILTIFLKRWVLFLLIITSLLQMRLSWAESGETINDPLLLDSEMLKHRIYVAVLPPHKQETKGEKVFIINTEGWNTLLLKEGVTIDKKEWATAIDLLKTELYNSKVFRPMNTDFATLDSLKMPQGEKDYLIMLSKFGVSTEGKRVFLYLVDSTTGDTLYTAETFGKTIQQAINNAIKQLEEDVMFSAWRCKVIDTTSSEMIVNRGEIDGLIKGVKLVGYSISAERGEDVSISSEYLIMKYGTRKGIYIVQEVGQLFSKVVPLNVAPLLKKGDILELPALSLKKRARDTRRRRLWDEIYKR